jgi:hypothetical protein
MKTITKIIDIDTIRRNDIVVIKHGYTGAKIVTRAVGPAGGTDIELAQQSGNRWFSDSYPVDWIVDIQAA